MRPTSRRPLLAIALLLSLPVAAPAPAPAVEGKWTPRQLLEHDPAWLRELGLELPPGTLWGPQGAGLLEAAISIGGCSAGFVSAEGLVATNHHCAFGLLQQHSTPERDLIEGGFLAASRDDELPGEGTRALLPHATRDVTAEVLAAVPPGADDLARHRAIERQGKELVAECERRPSRRCHFATFDGGVRYELVEGIEFPDVRVVYGPPRAVGEYGGEIDNWSWPRHTGDFALLRVWAGPDGGPAAPGKGTAPYRPRHFFPLSPDGVAPDDFVLVAGYPGRTFRAETATKMRQRAERFFPERARLLGAWMALLEEHSAAGDAPRIALASRIKTLANREKNARGQVAGIARGDLLAGRESEERAVLAWAAERPEHAGAVAAHAELGELVAESERTWERDFLLDGLDEGPLSVELALKLVRWATERGKPDAERDPDYQERNRDRLADSVRIAQRRLHRPAEEALLVHWLERVAALPAGARIAAVEPLLAGGADRAALAARVAALHAGSRVLELDERLRMFEETPEALRARRDPLLDLAFALDAELRALEERDDRHAGAVARLAPAWRGAVEAHAGRPVAPDANGTLRVSLAHVRGYEPRDAVRMLPQTTVGGMVEKHTGEAPFDVPDELLAAAPAAPASPWADGAAGDVPVAFLADGDTTGGSSGSPVLDGRGRLVGLNFDRVWENVANDFGYNPAVARNISVDVRFLLWVLQTTHGERAAPLLRELGVAAEGGAAATGR